MESNQVFISVQNLAPNQGTALTPVWVGLHDGEFDTYDRDTAASPGLESLAEDGAIETLSAEFDQSRAGTTQGAVAGAEGPIQPGESTGAFFEVENSEGQGQYLNYAAMVLPSNDFFVANGDPLAHQIFDNEGNFVGADFTVAGSEVLDAGTEVNDEIPENTAFFGQETPNTGVDENGVIRLADGFIEGGAILSSEDFANADFTAPDYQVARIRVLNFIGGDDTNETFAGTAADDYIIGNQGNDVIRGRQGNDQLKGGRGKDRLFGGNGDDELFGGRGRDYLFGGAGNDTLAGRSGNNVLNGGDGADVFALVGNGTANIEDFSTDDRIQLGSSLQFADLAITQNNQNTVIAVADNTLAVLENVDASTINESVFV